MDEIIVIAPQRIVPDLQAVQDFNASELARLGLKFPPPPDRLPSLRHDNDRAVGRANNSAVRGLIGNSRCLQDALGGARRPGQCSQ